jgi:hypothetical protein
MAESLAARITTEQAARAEAQRLQQLAAEHRQIVEDTLAELHQSIAIREQLSATVQDLSNPVLPVLDGLLVMPLIGVIDTARATVMVNALLQAIEQHRAQVVILDVSYPQEIARGDVHNLVAIVHRKRGISLETAVAYVIRRHNAEMRAFQRPAQPCQTKSATSTGRSDM